MTPAAAAQTDLHADMQQPVTPDPRPTPPTRCPRCARDVDPDDLLAQPRAELRLIDPHSARYDRQPLPAREGIALCDECARQIDAIAQEIDAQRRLMDDQRLSRTFEEIRDTAIEDVMGWAVWYDRRGHDTYLVVYETGEWAIHAVPHGQVYDVADDRGALYLPVPVAPPAADDEEGDADDEWADSALREIDVATLYRRRAPSDADHEPLEMDLATRFYRALYTCKE